jgi:hypothetical protein
MDSFKEAITVLQSIDLSLKVIASRQNENAPAVLVTKKQVADALGVKPVTVDKLVYQGIVSKGTSGLVERIHYCKLDPNERNTSNYRFNLARILVDAWNSFSNYEN